MDFELKEDGRYYRKDGNCNVTIDASRVITDPAEIQKKLDEIARIYIRAVSRADTA